MLALCNYYSSAESLVVCLAPGCAHGHGVTWCRVTGWGRGSPGGYVRRALKVLLQNLYGNREPVSLFPGGSHFNASPPQHTACVCTGQGSLGESWGWAGSISTDNQTSS